MKTDEQACRRPMTADEIDAFFALLALENPSPQTELVYSTPFTLLIAVVLSAQATDKGVNKATEKLFAVADTPQKILDLGQEGLTAYIKTIGLFPTKARNIISLCARIVDVYGGQVPHTREDLESLAGVGRKTANVVLNVAFGHPTMAVDTHIFRVSNRTGLAPGKTPRAVEEGLLQRVPSRFLFHAHHWLILHGRYTCVARAPRCQSCCVRAYCHYGNLP